MLSEFVSIGMTVHRTLPMVSTFAAQNDTSGRPVCAMEQSAW